MSRPVALGHVGLTVPDLDAAVAFYGAVLGWEPIAGPLEVSAADPRVAAQLADVFERDDVAFRQAHLLAADGVAVELFQFTTPPTSGRGAFDYARVGCSHLCVVEPRIERLVAEVVAHGGRQRTEIRPIFPDRPFRFCYCEDPFGNALEIATHPHAESFGGRAAY